MKAPTRITCQASLICRVSSRRPRGGPRGEPRGGPRGGPRGQTMVFVTFCEILELPMFASRSPAWSSPMSPSWIPPPTTPPTMPPTSSKLEANDLDTFATTVKEIIINRPAMSIQSKEFDDIPGTYMTVKGKCESKTAFFFFFAF